MKKRLIIMFLSIFVFTGIFLVSHYASTTSEARGNCGCSCVVICRYTCEFDCFDCTEAEEDVKGPACCTGAFEVTPDQGPCGQSGGQY